VRREIVDYYDMLAADYDRSRFGGSYGRFLDAAERAILSDWLPQRHAETLDLACGTGRLSDFADVGLDASERSLAFARRRHPKVAFVCGDADALPFADGSLSVVLTFHFLMHLEREALARVFSEAARVLRPGGVLILDVVSARRRSLAGRSEAGWHGATALDSAGLSAFGACVGLQLTGLHGVAMAPLHRLPESWRMPLAGLDARLCRIAPQAASFLVARFERSPT